jgi:hypothetical protein
LGPTHILYNKMIKSCIKLGIVAFIRQSCDHFNGLIS